MPNRQRIHDSIKKISVSGFKSISSEINLDIKPLTLLAGANSSGKSSFMQLVLLLKQTLDCDHDPGPLLLDGPNARFTSASQLFSKNNKDNNTPIVVGIYGEISYCKTQFNKHDSRKGLSVEQSIFWPNTSPFAPIIIKKNQKPPEIVLHPSMEDDEKLNLLQNYFGSFIKKKEITEKGKNTILGINQEKFFLSLTYSSSPWFSLSSNVQINSSISSIIHVPGLRGNPERIYKTTGTGPRFLGTFENYTASVIAYWGETNSESNKLEKLCDNLSRLGLTSKISAKRLNDAQIEITVGRLLKNFSRGRTDMVNIADVGFGVSQTLPVLVALLTAEPGQLVYLEQPEIHLHPKAQRALAVIIADAANRGVKVVAETHSALLLLGIQTLIAQNKIKPSEVALHWFHRNNNGETNVTTADLDENGAFGDWPVDFAETELEAEDEYIDAASQKEFQKITSSKGGR